MVKIQEIATEKKDSVEMEHRSRSWVGSLVDEGEGNGGGFLWDCWNDAGMLYEGLTTALRPGQ